MDKVNLKSEDFFIQRNNKIRPASACMPTSRVNFLRGNNIPYENPSNLSDDDYFMSLLNTKEAKAYCYNKYPWASGKYPPNQIHGMYSTYLDNIVCGKKVSDFKTNLTFEDYRDRIANGEVIMTSGIFGGLNGHAICFIGIRNSDFYVADPWGNMKNYKGYKKGDGYKEIVTYEEFLAYVKPVGETRKWGHVII